MRHGDRLAWAALVFLAMNAGACWAQSSATEEARSEGNPRPGFLSRFNVFGNSGEKQAKAKAKKKSAVQSEDAVREQQRANVEREVARQKRAREVFMRRQKVCDKIREIAYQTNQLDLIRAADDLEARAWAIYDRQRADVSAGMGSFRDAEAASSKTSSSDTNGRRAARKDR